MKPDPVQALRDILKPGDTILCVSRHRSRSGASRSVSLFVAIAGELIELDALAAPAIGCQLDRKHGGIRAYTAATGGDACAWLVGNLAQALGFTLRSRQM